MKRTILPVALLAILLHAGVPMARADEKYPTDFTACAAAFEAKDYDQAEQRFRAVLSKPTSLSVEGQARFNLGITLRLAKKYAESIKVFQSILTSGVNDRDPGDNLMEEFRNYRYRSCLQIAMCYEAQGDIPQALASAEMACTKYRYQAHCGTCAAQAKEHLDGYFKFLRSKTKKA